MKLKYIRLAFAAFAVTVCAASANADVWTLDSCINYAHNNNITVKQRKINAQNAELDITAAKDRFLPTAQAYASQSFDFGRGLTSENTYANRNTKSFGWGADVSLPLFQGLAGVRRLDYAKAGLLTALEQIEAAKDDLTLNIIAQYLQVLYSKEVSKIAADQAHLSQIELERRRELLEAGKIPELDLLQAESQLAAERLSAVNAQNDVTLALTDLASLLQIPYFPGFDVDSVADDEAMLPSVDDVFSNALANNHFIRAANYDTESARKNVRLAQTGYIPTLSLSAGLGSNWYSVSGFDNTNFGKQMRDNFAKRIGFTLAVPIFDAFNTRNQVRRARAAVVTAELQADDTRTRLYNNIQQAYVRATAARQKYQSGLVAERAARAAFDAMTQKYNFGRANATEYEQTKSAWFRTRGELVQSRYESILRARILNFYNRTNP